MSRPALVEAMSAGDREAVLEALAPDVVFRSPITSVRFEGREAVGALLHDVLEGFEWFRYELHAAQADSHMVVVTGRIGGRDVEMAQLIRCDDAGRTREIRIYSRPMAGTAAIARVLGPMVAARRSAALGRVVGVLMRPLPVMFALIDRLIERLGLTRAPG